jgi:hypothetical protein
MKVKILLLAFLVIFSSLTVRALDTTKIAQRWKLTGHTKKTHVLPANEIDFLQLDASHSYERVWEGAYTRGRWTINTSNNTLTLNSGTETSEWTITELTAHSFKISQKNEVWEMIDFPIQVCSGDPYDDLTIICGKWKVADHKAHYTGVHYKPGDYIRFFPDGTAEEVFLGMYKKLTWQYDSENSQLIISKQAWKINELKQKKLNAELASKNESMILVKL